MTYDVEDLTPCEHCGKPPLICEDDQGGKIRVDACFEGALLGGIHVSGCCGHGGRKPAYVRLRTRAPDGMTRYVDLCGFTVQPLLSYANPSHEKRWPPLNGDPADWRKQRAHADADPRRSEGRAGQ